MEVRKDESILLSIIREEREEVEKTRQMGRRKEIGMKKKVEDGM